MSPTDFDWQFEETINLFRQDQYFVVLLLYLKTFYKPSNASVSRDHVEQSIVGATRYSWDAHCSVKLKYINTF